MLYIKNIKHQKDGRSILETVGFKRIRCSNPRMYDGYATAEYTIIADKKITDESENTAKALTGNVNKDTILIKIN